MFFKPISAAFSTKIVRTHGGNFMGFHNMRFSGMFINHSNLNSHQQGFIKRLNRSTLSILPKTGVLFSAAPLTTGCPESSGPRIARQEPGLVRLGFIPDEWLMFFHKKTGTTGLGTFCFTVMITLMSKEFYVLEHEYYGGLSMILLCVLATRYLGPEIAKAIDSALDQYEKTWQDVRASNKQELENAIADENKQQISIEGQLMLVEAKRENVALQLEAVYRQRLMVAYNETKKRMDYCSGREAAEKALAKRCMTSWVVEQVKGSITKDIEKQALDKCYEDLKYLAKTYQGLSSAYEPPESPTAPPEPPTAPPKPPADPKKGKK